jgi:HAD superfamily hydrolase (TIGR01490 family)
MKNLALFDFDGTITKKDTLLEFIKFSHGLFKFYMGFFAHMHYLVLMKLNLYDNSKVKEKILIWFFRGIELNELNQKAIEFTDLKLTELVNEEALERIISHISNGDTVYVISASPENWIRPWAQSLGVNLIGTKLEVVAEKITGQISGKNCYGIEKVKRLKELENLSDYDSIYAYGDSRGDKELLEIAQHKFYRKFKK